MDKRLSAFPSTLFPSSASTTLSSSKKDSISFCLPRFINGKAQVTSNEQFLGDNDKIVIISDVLHENAAKIIRPNDEIRRRRLRRTSFEEGKQW